MSLPSVLRRLQIKQILKKQVRILRKEILSQQFTTRLLRLFGTQEIPSLGLKLILLFQKAGMMGPAEEMMLLVHMDGRLLIRKVFPEEKWCVGIPGGDDDTIHSVEEEGGCYEVSQGGGEDPPFAEEMNTIAPSTESYR